MQNSECEEIKLVVLAQNQCNNLQEEENQNEEEEEEEEFDDDSSFCEQTVNSREYVVQEDNERMEIVINQFLKQQEEFTIMNANQGQNSRDIKPGNIVLTKKGKSEFNKLELKIIDFAGASDDYSYYPMITYQYFNRQTNNDPQSASLSPKISKRNIHNSKDLLKNSGRKLSFTPKTQVTIQFSGQVNSLTNGKLTSKVDG
ncbi:hypothetical protein PPERSA_12863 [Pseudocohnilembus persalinus]|uniref:Protein kinase-like domain n=1 Tax=Pseudocohnilembus persalinus TaxID=266149 RepID=A0A0V0Q858_PSEPJ|nr:hypothetical protein PPERSA_12863 [Pseudocohnilembus persalinus]|eukprot:KRW98384.1 hypothetical protein PPERSA_12863 [Pseudocohnilembus persalinus]